VEVPVQYFQSVIAIELAVTGALLFEVDFFDRSKRRAGEYRTHPRILILFAVVLAATMFGSLAATLHGGQTAAASAVTVGLAVSVLPIMLRVLPPLSRIRTRTSGPSLRRHGRRVAPLRRDRWRGHRARQLLETSAGEI
jgi:quinol-cytochrome oxidoreductase complex cytochrome b subunit